MPSISLDSAYAPEVLEFWGRKYQETKEELEKLKATHTLQTQRNDLAQEYATLKNLITILRDESRKRDASDAELRDMMTRARKDEAGMRTKLVTADRERQDLAMHLARSHAEKASLRQQIHTFYSQAAVLSAEADQSRRNAIAAMFPAVSFVDPTFDCSLRFVNPEEIIRALPAKVSAENSIFFLPRPPSCMPLRVQSCGQPGYWFDPAYGLTSDTPFELVVEGLAGEWSHLGRYVSAHLENHPMKLAEWLTLDEQTKMAHCVRVASQNLPPDQTASYPAQLDVKRRYEVGEWNVPCYSLRCVGFDMPLYDALHAAAVEISSRNKDAVAGVGSEPQSASAKRRLDDSVATVASSHASKRGRCSSQPTQEPVTVSEKPAGKD